MLMLISNLNSKYHSKSVLFSTATCRRCFLLLFGQYQLSNKHFFEKTNPIFPRFWPKNRFLSKNKPNSKPIQTQFYTFLCKTNPNFPLFSPKTLVSPKNEPKTNPNQTQIKPTTNPILGLKWGLLLSINLRTKKREYFQLCLQ